MPILAYLSPAKSMRLGSPVGFESTLKATMPRHLNQSERLRQALLAYDSKGLQTLMDISEKLADLNVDRFKSLGFPLDEADAQCRRAVFLFDGDAYEGLAPENLDRKQLARLGERVRMLSGYYGLLRPGDLMRPYRLEMGRRPAGIGAKSLYEFWGDSIAKMIASDAESIGAKECLSLASEEYDLAARARWDASRPLHSSRFETQTPKGRKVISFDAKRARGLFARHLALADFKSVREAAEAFQDGGWSLDSSDARNPQNPCWTFVK